VFGYTSVVVKGCLCKVLEGFGLCKVGIVSWSMGDKFDKFVEGGVVW
jgi:hypothetical protein